MALITFDGLMISGIAVSVPANVLDNSQRHDLLKDRDLQKTIDMTGVTSRRITDTLTCSSDLCLAAAESLIAATGIARSSIDLLVFVSQTPDYRLPATAPLLQQRLGLATSTAAFDVNLGCSGYVYGLAIACSFVSHLGASRALVLAGDTPSKFVSPYDRATALLFGDAGSATLIEPRQDGEALFFSLNSDGSGENSLKINAGGYRFPSSAASVTVQDVNSGRRSEEQLHMDSAAIFNFTIREVPRDIRNVVQHAGCKLDDIDFVVYHQANKFMLDHLTKKLGYPLAKTPRSLERYGNTSCATIPLTIVTELRQRLRDEPARLVLSGFGVGLSWASAVVTLNGCCIPPLVEV